VANRSLGVLEVVVLITLAVLGAVAGLEGAYR
jgi:hypothetical protein